MAEAAALAGVGWVISPILSRLLNEGLSYLGVGDTGIKDRLESLEIAILPQFQLMVEAAERSEHKTELNGWLRKLKDAMYEADEMLDLYQYKLLEEKVHLSHPTPKPCRKFVGKLKKGLSSIFSPQIKLRNSLIKLERVAAEAKTFRELLGMPIGNSTANGTTSERRPNVSTSLPPPQVFGRNEECDEIINKYLLDNSEVCESEMGTVRRRNYSVISIVGIGGAGKTTVAQLVFNDQRVVNNFNIKMWVCMSRKFDVFRITREMIESASKDNCPLLENFDALQRKLIDKIESKKILLVLDDVWCYKSEDEKKWEELLAPLAFGKNGCKILVTTRPENMANMPVALHSQKIMELKDLEEDQFTSLFMHYAFHGTNLSDMHFQEELKTIGKQILQKLSRSPLAAKAVGCQLRNRLEVEVWRATLEQDNLSDIQKALIWSYQRLDAPLQRCFSFCSLFPKGHTFKAVEMVHLWMAEGFINPSDDSKRMEDIGNDYWNELVSGSFLQLDEEYGTDAKYCYMHDLFHDLAERVSKEDCFRIEDDQVKKIPETICHLYISSESMREGNMSFDKLEKLRTLIIPEPLSNSAANIPISAIEKVTKLRVLKLSSWKAKSLPKFIRDLKHLRYLDLRDSTVAKLPASLGKLHHLQLLKLPNSFISIPRSLMNLLNLRHLEADHNVLLALPDIGRLTSLQGLRDFEVKKKTGYDIGQLKNLNELRGSLTISYLENVEGKNQAIEANLRDKKYLHELCLSWSHNDESDCNTYLDMEVVEGLQPHPNLKRLKISGCKSRACPSWLIHEGCLKNLSFLSFVKDSFEDLPIISRLFPHCRKMEFSHLPNFKMLPSLPQNLRVLVIDSCPSLVLVSEEKLQKSDDRKKFIMTDVQSSELNAELKIMEGKKQHEIEPSRDCLEVRKLMETEKLDMPEDLQLLATSVQRMETILPSALQHLEIVCCPNITDEALLLCLEGLDSLKLLVLNGIRTITTIPTDRLMGLCELRIANCPCLRSLGALHALISLESLCISCCPCLELETMEDEGGGGTSSGRVIFPPSLQFLSICNGTTVKRFAIGDLPSLSYLELCKLPSLASLSLSGLTALKILEIRDCPELSALVCPQPLDSSLEILIIQDVPKLVEAPLSQAVRFSSVEVLRISSWATLRMLLSGGSNHLADLNILHIYSCPDVSFDEESFNCLTSLKTLELLDCKVKTLPTSLKTLSSLEELMLVDCQDISSLSSNLPESLKSLAMTRCHGISSLSGLPNSLHHLYLVGCSQIKSLPGHLPESLRSITVSSCPELTTRCREPEGEDWPKIARIPNIYMDTI